MKILIVFLFLFVPHSFYSILTAQTYDEWVALSFELVDKGDLPAAETALKEALHKEPANQLNVMLLSNLGTIQRRQGKYGDALVSYTAALGRAPKSTTLLLNRAELFVEMNQPENALMDYSSLLLVEDTNESALYQRGMLYLQVKNYEAAQADFEKILKLNPETYEGRIGIVSLCKLRGEYDDAETIYYFLLSKFPDNPDLYAGRAELYLLMKKSGKAMTDINKAIQIREKSPNPYFFIIRSRIKDMQYEKKGAQEDREKAVGLGYKE